MSTRARPILASHRHPDARTLLLAVGIAWIGTASGAGFVALDLRQRLAGAQEAAVGVVAAVDVELRDGEPWSLVTLEVERWWRRAGRRVDADASGAGASTAAFWGGRGPGLVPLQVAGVPTFTVGERVLWLLRDPDGGLAAPTVGVTQGVWRAVAGVWRGDDGSQLGIDENGDLRLGGDPAADIVVFAALDAAFDALELTP